MLWSALAGCLIVGAIACDTPAAKDDESTPDTGLPVTPADSGTPIDAAAPGADAATLPQADAGRSDFIPKCHETGDGRCGVCVWTDGAAQRCRVTIFRGNCPAGSSSAESCPANPTAACDRAEGYFDLPRPSNSYGDWDFYYAPVAATAQQDCLAQSATLAPERGPRWVTY
jgi:hypothetical protein